MSADFCANLRLLSDHYKSIAEVCRRLGVNRSQFNKYLNGRSRPSRHIMKKICDFFGVEEYEVLLPHKEFDELIRLRSTNDTGAQTYASYLEQLVERSRGDRRDYDGYYAEYGFSMAYPGLILRSLMRFSSDARVTTYQRLENLARPGADAQRVRGRYWGVGFYLNDRIFLVDYDSLAGIEISQTILYPSHEMRRTRLVGLKLGVSSSKVREPLCVRVVLVALGRSINLRKTIGGCGLYDPDSPEIEPDIKAMIENTVDDGAHHFQVFTGTV